MKQQTKTFVEKFIDRLKKADPEQIEIIITNLLKEKSFLNFVVNNVKAAIFIVDFKMRIIYVNDSARRIFNIPQNAKIVSDNIAEVIKSKKLTDKLGYAIENNLTSFTDDFTNKSRTSFLHADIINKTDDEEFPCYIIVFHDLTENQLFEHENRCSDRLDSLSTLTAGLAHDIKNPLNSLNIHSQLIETLFKQYSNSFITPKTAETITKSIKAIMRETGRINSLVDGLIMNSMPVRLKLKPFSINKIIESTTLDINTDLEIKGIRIISDLDPEIPENPMDAEQIHRCLLNAIKNSAEAIDKKKNDLSVNAVATYPQGNEGRFALNDEPQTADAFFSPFKTNRSTSTERSFTIDRFTKDERLNGYKGIIFIRTYMKDNYILIDIEDNGCGISDENIRRVFDPYWTTKFSGTGLGLMLAHKIIREHKGYIQIFSRLNEGTILTMSLPLVKKPLRLLPQPQKE